MATRTRKRKRTKADVSVSTKKDGVTEKKVTEIELEWSDVGDSPHATVEVRAGVTREIGDYEFLRVDIGITRPCRSNDDALKQCYEHTADQVAEMLTTEQEEYFSSTKTKK